MTEQVQAAMRQFNPPHGSTPEAIPEIRPFGNALNILRMKQLVERTKLSRATLYLLIANDPTFPRKIKLTARTVGWLESDINLWIASRAANVKEVQQ